MQFTARQLNKLSQKAEKDAEKAAKAAAAPAKKKSAEEEEDELDANQYKERRQLFVKHLEQAGTTAYPHKFHVDTTLPSFHEQYASCPDGEKVVVLKVYADGELAGERAFWQRALPEDP